MAWRGAARALLFLAVGALFPFVSTFAQSEQPVVIVGEIDGTITPVMARYVEKTIERAEHDGAAAVVFEMDTPGGLSSAMDDIIDDFTRSEVPVVVYVAPRGARAASAGVFITYAAQVAAMAPGTNIGSASPVFLGADGSTSDVDDTMTAKGHQRRGGADPQSGRISTGATPIGRNPPSGMPRTSPPTKRLQLGVIEYIAPDLPTLLDEIDGITVELASGPVTLVDCECAHGRRTNEHLRTLPAISVQSDDRLHLPQSRDAGALLRAFESRRIGARHRRSDRAF